MDSAKPDDPATEEPGRDGTDQRDQQHADDQPYAGHIGKAKLVKSGKNAGHLTVNQLNGPPGDIDGEQYWSCNQKAGEKPRTQTAENTGTLCLLGSVFLDHQGSSRRRVAALIMVRNMNWRKGVCRHHLHFKGRHFGPCQCCASGVPVVCQCCTCVVPCRLLAKPSECSLPVPHRFSIKDHHSMTRTPRPDSPTKAGTETQQQLDRIIEIMRQLRDPQTGCPWDVEQDFASIAPYTIEEAYEVADAVQRGDTDDIRDELGDLLLQVVFQARIAEEAGLFSLADVARSISDKMVDRHPHVFGDDGRPQLAEQSGRWEAIKAEERARKGHTGILDDVAAGLPPMLRALKLQKRAARVGFDWVNIDDIIAKLHEETAELRAETTCDPVDQARVEDEVGDVLFVAVNLARRAGVDPETALMACNSKFESRFRYIEKHAENFGKNMNDMSLEEMESLWQESKTAGRRPD